MQAQHKVELHKNGNQTGFQIIPHVSSAVNDIPAPIWEDRIMSSNLKLEQDSSRQRTHLCTQEHMARILKSAEFKTWLYSVQRLAKVAGRIYSTSYHQWCGVRIYTDLVTKTWPTLITPWSLWTWLHSRLLPPPLIVRPLIIPEYGAWFLQFLTQEIL